MVLSRGLCLGQPSPIHSLEEISYVSDFTEHFKTVFSSGVIAQLEVREKEGSSFPVLQDLSVVFPLRFCWRFPHAVIQDPLQARVRIGGCDGFPQ